MKENGFTFIEIIIVIAIMGALGTLSSIFYSRFISQNAVFNTSDQLVQSLRKAQIYAMVGRKSNSLGWGVKWDSVAHRIILFQGNTFTGRNSALDETFTVNSNISISGLTEVDYTRVTGLPSPTSATITISSASGNNSETVTLNSQGVASR